MHCALVYSLFTSPSLILNFEFFALFCFSRVFVLSSYPSHLECFFFKKGVVNESGEMGLDKENQRKGKHSVHKCVFSFNNTKSQFCNP